MLRYVILWLEKAQAKKEVETLSFHLKENGVSLMTEKEISPLSLEEVLWIVDRQDRGLALLQQHCSVIHLLSEENAFSNIPYAIESLEAAEYSYLERIYRRYHKIPWEIVETKRCRVREIQVEDVDRLYEIYQDSSITTYMEGLFEDPEEEREHTKSYIQNAYGFWGFGTWVIVWKETNQVIGRAGFNLRDGFEEPELGYVLDVNFQKQGIAFEVCEALLEVGKADYAFSLVQALSVEGNLSSQKLLEKLGFWLEEKITIENQEYCRYLKKL